MRQAGEIALLVLIPLISVIGAFGNFILLTFFIKKQFTGSSLASKLNSSITSQRLTTNTFIMVLAANDFIASILVMPLTLIYEVSPQLIFTTDLMCKFYYFVTTSVIPFSAFLIVAIAIDRYLCIVHPLKVILTNLGNSCPNASHNRNPNSNPNSNPNPNPNPNPNLNPITNLKPNINPDPNVIPKF